MYAEQQSTETEAKSRCGTQTLGLRCLQCVVRQGLQLCLLAFHNKGCMLQNTKAKATFILKVISFVNFVQIQNESFNHGVNKHSASATSHLRNCCHCQWVSLPTSTLVAFQCWNYSHNYSCINLVEIFSALWWDHIRLVSSVAISKSRLFR